MARHNVHAGFSDNDPVHSMSVEGKLSEEATDLFFRTVKIDKPALVKWWDKEADGMVKELQQNLKKDGFSGRLYAAGVGILKPVLKHAIRIMINKLVSD